jgi:hypothetical protein
MVRHSRCDILGGDCSSGHGERLIGDVNPLKAVRRSGSMPYQTEKTDLPWRENLCFVDVTADQGRQ